MEFKTHGAISGYDSTTGTQQNISSILNELPSPLDITVDTRAVPSILVGLNSNNKNGLLAINSVRTDLANKDVGIATYPLCLSTVLIAQSDTASRNNVTFYNVSATGRTFITGLNVSAMWNATSDGTGMLITAVDINGVTQTIWYHNKLTLTADSVAQFITFNTPMELQAGSTLKFTIVSTVGAITDAIIAYGYKVAS